MVFISGLGPKVVLSFWSQALSNRSSSFYLIQASQIRKIREIRENMLARKHSVLLTSNPDQCATHRQ
jgi:hypothetical protein